MIFPDDFKEGFYLKFKAAYKGTAKIKKGFKKDLKKI